MHVRVLRTIVALLLAVPLVNVTGVDRSDAQIEACVITNRFGGAWIREGFGNRIESGTRIACDGAIETGWTEVTIRRVWGCWGFECTSSYGTDREIFPGPFGLRRADTFLSVIPKSGSHTYRAHMRSRAVRHDGQARNDTVTTVRYRFEGD